MTAVAEDLDATFEAALAADAGIPDGPAADVAPPPRRPAIADPEAPHGRAADGTPNAPYGIGKNGRPRITPGGPGRPAKKDPDAAARTGKPAAGAATAAVADRDYSGDLGDLIDGVWMLLSAAPAPGGLKIKIGAQAAVLQSNRDSLVRGGAIAAKHHPPTAALIEKLTSGNAAWALPCMFALGPFVAQSVAVWRSPAADLADLARGNDERFRAVLEASMSAVGDLAAEAEEIDRLAAEAEAAQ